MDWNMYLLVQKPFYQALLFVILTPVIILIMRPKEVETAWVIAACSFAVFLIVNAGLLWFADDPWRYFFHSIGFAIGSMLLIAILMPGVLHILRLKGSAESAMAFLILIYQPFALLLVMLAKWMVNKWF